MSARRVVLITGASGGIGGVLAQAFGASGDTVVLHYHRGREKAEQLARTIEAGGAQTFCVSADLRDPAAVRAMVADIVARAGGLDVLVNNAAVTRDRSILKMAAEEWNEVVDADLSGAFYVLQEAARHMAKQKDGAVINIASIAAFRGSYGAANYASAKAGLVALTKAAARELGRFGVRVNCVLPGFHLTAMSARLPEDYRKNVVEESVLGTTTDSSELAHFIVFLSGMRTVSGQVFNWDSRII